jgi:hypothetical protein
MSKPPVAAPCFGKRCLTRALLFLFAVGCNNASPAGKLSVARGVEEGKGLVAMVGQSGIALETLRQAVQHFEGNSRARLAQLIELRAYGLYAQEGGLERGRRQMTERAILARALLERVEEKGKVSGTPTDDEVNAMTETRWIEFDRPDAVTTCHAIVHAQGLDEAAGISLAQRLADALRPLTQCQAFIERAQSFAVAGAKVTAERLPPVTADGRTMILDGNGEPVDEGEPFDADFARGAHQIKIIGGQSNIVRTRFGWHVILLESRVPSKHISLEERRSRLAADILRQRAKERSERLIAELRQRATISVERAAIQTVDRVRVEP